MNIKELFSGVAIIIDNKINDTMSDDLIIKIRDKLRNNNTPILEYIDIPDNKAINGFKNINFILLDWQLYDDQLKGTKTAEKYIKRNIAFIKKFRKITFAPIFIFSNQSPDDIIYILEEKKLYKKNFNNYIFVKSKIDLFSKDRKRFLFWSKLMNWLKCTPSIYVLKEWERSLNKAKRDLFWSFYDVNHNWPSVLHKTFIDDGSDVNYELGNFIFKNIMARTEPIEFDEEILKLEDDKIEKYDIRKVLEAERFIINNSLPPDISFTGDLFQIKKYELSKSSKSEKDIYYLNIRPECDIAHGSNPVLYCIEGKIVDEKTIDIEGLLILDELKKLKEKKIDNDLINDLHKKLRKNKVSFEKGSFIEKINKVYVPFIHNGKILEFSFNELETLKWNQQLFKKNGDNNNLFKNARIGRILPPYITRIQQKYAFYLQRQGLPAIPKRAINDE